MMNPDSSRIVLVGCHTYENLDDLPSVKNNLSRLAEVLTHPLIGGLNPDTFRILEQPGDPKEVLDATYDAADECADTLIFYYSGHGLTSLTEGGLSLALPGTIKHRPHTSVRFDDVRLAVLSARKAPRKVVILDCCFSARAMTGSMGDSSDLASRSEIEGTYILAAAAETKTALAPIGAECTAFTGEMLHILENGIMGGPEFLTLDLIYSRLHSRLTSRSLPVPQQRNRNEGARIALARNAGFSAERKQSINIGVLEYMEDVLNGDVNTDLLMTEVHSVAFPYSQRIRNAKRLAYYDRGLTSDMVEVLEGFVEAKDINELDKIAAIAAIARLDGTRNDWARFALDSILHDSSELPMAREVACRTLDEIGYKEQSFAGYRFLLADTGIGLTRRVLTAEDLAHAFPDRVAVAVQFMWVASKDEKLSIRGRIDILRKLCALDPASIPAASGAIDRLRQQL
ncbi:caspase, EACC1-associated type [Streptomyces sp. NPDC002308]